MVIFRIPKSINIIGENTNKTISIATCNFSIGIEGSLDIGDKYLCSGSKEIFNYLKESKETRKDEIIKHLYKTKNSFYFSGFISNVFGGMNATTITNDSWFNIKIKENKTFTSYLLIYNISEKFFTYKKNKEQSLLKSPSLEKMSLDFYDSYQKENWNFLGQLINSFWKIKKDLDLDSTNNYIDKIYSDCRLNGVIGGKMDNSTMILFAPQEKHEKIKKIMFEHDMLNSSTDMSGYVTEEVFSGISNCCK